MTQPNQYEDKELREIENALMQLANFPSHHKLKKAMKLITQKQLETERQILKDMQFRLKDALRPSSDIRKIIRLRLALEAVEFRLAESEKGRKL